MWPKLIDYVLSTTNIAMTHLTYLRNFMALLIQRIEMFSPNWYVKSFNLRQVHIS